MTTDELTLLHRYLAGILTEPELENLEHLLRRSSEARATLRTLATIDAKWQQLAALNPAEALLASGKPNASSLDTKWLQWRPLTTAMAAGLAIAALLAGLFLSDASAAAMLRHTLKTHLAGPDRCYRVSVGWHPLSVDNSSPARRETRVWTRGDRFWVQARSDERTAVWGRDERGRVWFAASPHAGGWFEPDEVPSRLAQVCELRTLHPESLLRSLLADFDLRREPDAAGNRLIHAEPKPGREHSAFRGALLEIDAGSGVLRRAVVQRVSEERSPVPVTFTLVESSLLEDTTYTLAGHLSADAEIFDRDSPPGLRTRAMLEFLRIVTGREKTNP